MNSGRPFPAGMCTTPVTVKLTNGIAESGEPEVVATWTGLCYYSERSRNVNTKDGPSMGLESYLIIEGDIAPQLLKLEGSVQLFNREDQNFKIALGSRPRYPNGAVLYTRLELM